MPMTTTDKDLARIYKPALGISPQVLTDTFTGLETDIIGSSYEIVIQLNVGALTGVDADNRFEISIEQSEDPGGTYTAANAWQYLPIIIPGDTVNWDLKIDDSGEADKIYWLNFRPEEDMRYIKIKITKVGTPINMACTAFAWWIPKEIPSVDT